MMRSVSLLVLMALVSCDPKSDTGSVPADTATPPDADLPITHDSGLPEDIEDSGVEDSGVQDSGVQDSGVQDTGIEDSGEPTPPTDLDGDGFSELDGDCDDLDSSRHPGRTEVCDGLDNDCDGLTDEDVIPSWYLDGDGDGHGTTDFTFEGCSPLADYVALSDDCNDSAPLIFPGATEHCDGIDNDCDSSIDEEGAIGGSTFYLDADMDGFGSPSAPTVSCSMPPGFVINDLDCDDHDNDIHPEALELCDDEDNDCDGSIDEAGAAGEFTWYEDADGDGFGDDSSATSACDLPVGSIVVGGDCDDSDRLIGPYEIEQCNGVDDDCDGEIDEPDAADASTFFVDSDGDGFGDSDLPITACAMPDGSVDNPDDCDDADDTVYPGADEILADGIDQDCDGEDKTTPPYTGSEPGWYHGNYDGLTEVYNPGLMYNGTVSCPTTCEAFGLSAVGMRFVCNLQVSMPGGSTEGCYPANEGLYGDANCGKMVRDMVSLTENDNHEDCAGGRTMDCVTDSCSEAVTYHAIECQCD
jgi:hypothetical protein